MSVRKAARRRVVLIAWMGALAGVVVALQRAGHGQLAPPPLDGRALPWLTTRPPDIAAFALLRCLTLVLTLYLLAVSVASVVTRMSGHRRLIRWSDMVTPASLRRFVAATVGLTLTAAPLVGPASAMASPSAPTAASVLASPSRDPAPILELLGPPPATGPATTQRTPTPPTWLVQPGENFWSIATHVLVNQGRPPVTPEVATYWRLLIKSNVGQLRIRSDPGLIYAGQRLDVPPPPTSDTTG
jgi:hypothetical protein